MTNSGDGMLGDTWAWIGFDIQECPWGGGMMVAAFKEKNMCVMSDTDYGSSEGNAYVVV